MLTNITTLFAVSGLAYAAVLPAPTFSNLAGRAAGASAASQLLEIAPTSNTCSGAPFPSECRTAEQAAPYLIAAMATYSITSPPEIAALLSLVAFETGDFKYATNHYPGRAGQGTRNMQMANYNLMYAKSISALSGPLAAITTASSTDGLGDDQLNAIRALVLPDEYAWGSAAWFLTSQCASVRSQIQAGGQAGYSAYLGCVGTAATDDRLAYWTRANTAMGIA